jgi:hypothetical protein
MLARKATPKMLEALDLKINAIKERSRESRKR